MNKTVDKYLTLYSELEIKQLINFPPHTHYKYSLVIPAYQESIGFITQFFHSNLAKENVLLIVVVNQPDNDNNKAPQKKLFEQAKCLGKLVNLSYNVDEQSTTTFKEHTNEALTENIVHVNIANNASDLLIINRFEHPIPHKKGVGLARKIGCDVACALIYRKIIASEFIASSDADAKLPNNYFAKQSDLLCSTSTNVNLKNNAYSHTNSYSAACYSFRHVNANVLSAPLTTSAETLTFQNVSSNVNKAPNINDSNVILNATLQYEQALRYYVAGLHYADSPYAFFTIGSVLLFHITSYAAVRGFPQKSAGEDFYLLNKLAKVGNVHNFTDSTIELSARLSSRVPFGTGPAVIKIIELEQQKKEYYYYNPSVFCELKKLNTQVNTLSLYLLNVEEWLANVSLPSQDALRSIGFDKFIQQHKGDSELQFCKQWLVWFDAFKTLKFIHALRDIAFPDIPLREALKTKVF